MMALSRGAAVSALHRVLGLFSTLGWSWRAVGILFVLGNLKNLPLVWHVSNLVPYAFGKSMDAIS
jgi:hypothetical protein